MDILFYTCIFLSIITSYLFGSINFAILISRAWKKEDIRDFGSKNAGMTNMLRTYGKLPALFTLLGDLSKGIVSILIARLIFYIFSIEINLLIELLVALTAAVGHIYPIFYRFKGGKGVLVSAGAVILLAPIPVLLAIVVFMIVLMFSKIVSLSSISAAISAPIFTYLVAFMQNDDKIWTKTIVIIVLALFIIAMHWQNIGRLINGTEHKFGQKK